MGALQHFARMEATVVASLGKWIERALGDQKFHLPVDHKPYMVLPKGGSGPFSCANCKALDKQGDDYHCKSPDYERYMKTTLLVAEDGKTALDDPSRACSDWFTPTASSES